MIPNILNRYWFDILYKEGIPYPQAPGDVAACILDCAISKESDRGSVATAACCRFAYALAANLFPRIPNLIGIYNNNVDSTLNIETKLTTVVLDFLALRIFPLILFLDK